MPANPNPFVDPRVRALFDAASEVLRNIIDADQYGPDDCSGADTADWPRDEDGDLWYPDVWNLSKALDAISKPAPVGTKTVVDDSDADDDVDDDEEWIEYEDEDAAWDDAVSQAEKHPDTVYQVWIEIEIEMVNEALDVYESLDAPGASVKTFNTYDEACAFVASLNEVAKELE